MELGLQGRLAVVTGASRGIGLATARRLAAEGAQVIGVARRPGPDLLAVAPASVALDLTAPGSAGALRDAVGLIGDPDVVVANVGGGDALRPDGFASLSDEDWAQTFDVNLFATVRTLRALLPGLQRRGGSVVSVSSIGARKPDSGLVAYDTAKAALTALGRALAAEYSPLGVRVNTVSPGPTRTALWDAPDSFGAGLAARQGIAHEDFLRDAPAAVGMLTGRFVTPEEVADLIVFLGSDRAASITGRDHVVDGGLLSSV